MKHISLKIKLTLLYTVLMTAVVCAILALLFSLSGQELLTGVQARLEQEVAAAGADIEYDGSGLDFDSDIMDLEYGIYLSVYDSEGYMHYGRVPYDFDNSAPFENGNIRRFDGDGVSFYVLDMVHQIEGYGPVVVRGVASITDAEGNFHTTIRLAVILLPLIAAATAVMGYLMTRKALKPVGQITETVRKIQRDGDISRRIRLGNGRDEIYRMAATFDDMLEQVESGMKRERQFTSDVSHELRTPIAAMMLQCEELLSRTDLTQETREGVEMLPVPDDFAAFAAVPGRSGKSAADTGAAGLQRTDRNGGGGSSGSRKRETYYGTVADRTWAVSARRRNSADTAVDEFAE